jgi:hypothetical protein
MKQAYRSYKPQKQTMVVIAAADEWLHQNYMETDAPSDLRGLYYGLVNMQAIQPDSGDSLTNYRSLIGMMTKARQAGLIDWNHIDDKMRTIRNAYHWDSPAQALQGLIDDYTINIWKGQHTFPEVWHEKATGEGVIKSICKQLGVPYLCCRGNNSQPAMRDAAERARERFLDQGQRTVILHAGDLDVNGLDMTRDIRDRAGNLYLHGNSYFGVRRIALNNEQVKQRELPMLLKFYKGKSGPERMRRYCVPTGLTMVGNKVPVCELSSIGNLELQNIIRDEVNDVISDPELMQELFDKQEADREALREFAQTWVA